MKSVAINQPDVDEIIDWFSHNKVRINFVCVGNNPNLKLRLAECVQNSRNSSGAIDFVGSSSPFAEILFYNFNLKYKAPFKFGKVANISFSDSPMQSEFLSVLDFLDFSELTVTDTIWFTRIAGDHNVTSDTEIAAILAKLHNAKAIAKLKIVYKINRCPEKSSSGLISSVNHLTSSNIASFSKIYLNDNSYINIIHDADKSELSYKMRNEDRINFDNVMDLQEWLFDNRFEYLL